MALVGLVDHQEQVLQDLVVLLAQWEAQGLQVQQELSLHGKALG